MSAGLASGTDDPDRDSKPEINTLASAIDFAPVPRRCRVGGRRAYRMHTSCRPAVDVMFRSVAALYGASAYATVLTGMGQDGRGGAKVLRDAGAEILAQDEATSVVWGMPGAVVGAGLADEILPLDRIAAFLVNRVKTGRSAAVAR